MIASHIYRASVASVFLLVSVVTADQTIHVIAWNVQSGGAQPSGFTNRIQSMDGVDLWGFSEAKASWRDDLESAAEDGENADFKSIVGTTGGGDRLVIVYNDNRLEKVRSFQRHDINPGRRVRSPLVAQFRIRSTGQEFLFMVNHLYRGSASGRHQQSTKLNQWARNEDLPIIAVGDYNYDWKLPNGSDRDDGFDLLTEDGVFTWVRPAPPLIRTQFSHDAPNRHSILDFVFLANAGTTVTANSEIVEAIGDFPDNSQTPDHRPIRAFVTWRTGDAEGQPNETTREGILRRIRQLQSDLDELMALVLELEE